MSAPSQSEAPGSSLPENPPRRRQGDTNPTGVVVVIPAYNEARFIGSVVLMARRYAGEVIVVDDGSTDQTAEIAEAAGAVVLGQGENRGKGAALSVGLEAACRYQPEVIVVMDADFQHLPSELPRLVAPILASEAEIVLGSRYLRPTSKVPSHRVWGHRLFNLLTQWASGTAASDSQSGFRAFSPVAAEKLSFHAQGFEVESEMQFLAHQLGLRMLEVPITIQYTDKPKRPAWQHGLRVLNGLLRLVGQYRPLLFFGGSGMFFMLGGFLGGLWVWQRYRAFGQLATGTALVSVMLAMLGVVLFSTGVILHSVRGLIIEMSREWGRH